MKVKGLKKFKELGIDNCYQQLNTEDYFALRRGETFELEKVPQHLIDGEYVEIIKNKEKK